MSGDQGSSCDFADIAAASAWVRDPDGGASFLAREDAETDAGAELKVDKIRTQMNSNE